MSQHQNSLPQFHSLMLCVTLCCACFLVFGTALAQRTEDVVVAPIGADGEVTTSSMTREELEDQVRRYADRYYTRIAVAANEVRAQSTTPEKYLLMQQWKSLSLATSAGSMTDQLRTQTPENSPTSYLILHVAFGDVEDEIGNRGIFGGLCA